MTEFRGRLPLFKYFGSKCRSGKYYPAPRYSTIIEPFAGGAGYSLRYRDRNVILLDLDDELIRLWQWLITADPAEIAALPHESLVVGQDIRSLGLRPEAADLIRRWQRTGSCSSWTVSNFNHIVRVEYEGKAVGSGPGKAVWLPGPVPNGTVGKNTGMWHPNTRAYLAHAVTTIRHWQAYHAAYWQVEPSAAPEATWFIDPPYQKIKGGYRIKDPIDYRQLELWARRLPGQVIVCEQEGADWLPFRPSHRVSGIQGKMRGVKGGQSTEVIWTND